MSQKGVSKILKALVTQSSYTQNELAKRFKISQEALNEQLNGGRPVPVSRICELVKLFKPGASILHAINKELSEYKGIRITEDGNSIADTNWTKAECRVESPEPLDHDSLIARLETEKKIAVLKLERARIDRKIASLEGKE